MPYCPSGELAARLWDETCWPLHGTGPSRALYLRYLTLSTCISAITPQSEVPGYLQQVHKPHLEAAGSGRESIYRASASINPSGQGAVGSGASHIHIRPRLRDTHQRATGFSGRNARYSCYLMYLGYSPCLLDCTDCSP